MKKTISIAFIFLSVLWSGTARCGEFALNPELSFLRAIPGVPDTDTSRRITEGSFVLNNWALLEQSPGSYHNHVGGSLKSSPLGSRTAIAGLISGLPNPAGPFRPTLDSLDSPSTIDNLAAKDHLTGQLIELVIRDVVYEVQGDFEIGQPAELEFQFNSGTIDFSFIEFDRDGERDNGWLPLNELEMSGSTDRLRFENVSSDVVSEAAGKIEVPVLFDIPIHIIRADDSRVSVEGLFVLESPDITGDFDEDGLLSIQDINALIASTSLVEVDAKFDLDSNGAIDLADIQRWANEFGTSLGDTNLDGTVAFDDFLALSTAFGSTGVWSDGNFDTDGTVGFSDFLLLADNFGFEFDQARSVSTPEPGQTVSLFFILLVTSYRRRLSLG